MLKLRFQVFFLSAALGSIAVAQSAHFAETRVLPTVSPAQAPAPAGELESVLSKMDATAASFRTTQADFVWENYTKVVNDTDTLTGTVYYRRTGKEIEMMADIHEPIQKYVLFHQSKVQMYEPKIDQVTVYEAGKNRDEIESYLVLGFGGGGHDLLKSFEVQFLGTEKLDGNSTAKLELIPKSQKLRGTLEKIWLWIDPERGVSIQQQFLEPAGDYRLAKYTAIRMNQKIGEEVFHLKTTSKTKYVSPGG